MKEEKVELGEDFLNVRKYTDNNSESKWDELTPIKQSQIAEWIRNQKPTIFCLQETHMRQVDTHRVKMKGWNKIYWASTEKKKAGVAILISDKVEVKIERIKRDREGNYILIKGRIDNEEIPVLNMYAPNGITSKFLKEKLAELKEIKRW